MDNELRNLVEEAEALNDDEKKQKERNKELSLSLGIHAYLNTLSDNMYARGEDVRGIHDCMKMWQKLHNRYFYGNDTGYDSKQADSVNWNMMKEAFDKSLTPELAKLKNEKSIEYSKLKKQEHISCENCKCGYWTMFDNEYGRYPVILCYLHKDCGGDEAYPIMEDEWVETAKECKEFMNDNKDKNMSAEVKKELMKLIGADDVKYLNQAIHNINARREGVRDDYDISNPREMKHCEYVFDEDDTDTTPIPIDIAINKLTEYKDAGFTHVGYDDWDDALVAIYYTTQSPSEHARGIYQLVDSEIKSIKRNEMTDEKRLAKIEKLEKQIEELKKELEQDKDS